jgi:hypothetical protein
MSRIRYAAGNWTPNSLLFTSHRQDQGPLAMRHGRTIGGTSAYVLLDPDIAMPGGTTNNPPTAAGAGWNAPWAGVGGPALCFTQDGNQTWIRGHLVNGEWDGSGANWDNLVPMTSGANANHKWVEARMKVYLQNFRAFEENSNGGHNAYWYGLQYWVQASTDPWAAVPAAADLYSYAPNMIKVTWRIVTVQKPAPGTWPTGMASVAATPAWINATPALIPATMATIGLDLPNLPANNIPAALVNNPANLAATGGPVFALPVGAPAIHPVASPYDGTVEVMQD